jgi:hypothetical protein
MDTWAHLVLVFFQRKIDYLHIIDYLIILLMACTGMLILPLVSTAAQVTLAWNASADPDIEGYRIYCRAENQLFESNDPVWDGNDTTCTIYYIEDNTTYYFVARAYNRFGVESGNSNEIQYRFDLCDSYRYPPDEPTLLWPVAWEGEVVLTPRLTVSAFEDMDEGDVHTLTHWQIFRNGETEPVFDSISPTWLTELDVPADILEADASYVWQVRFFDQCGITSSWSEMEYFQTVFQENGFGDDDGVVNGIIVDTSGYGVPQPASSSSSANSSNPGGGGCFIDTVGGAPSTGWPGRMLTRFIP